MMTIRPVSDLRNKFPEIEEAVLQDNEPVFLTKNGYGTMVLMSIEQYSALTDAVEKKLDEADAAAAQSTVRYSTSEVFGRARRRIHADKNLKAALRPPERCKHNPGTEGQSPDDTISPSAPKVQAPTGIQPPAVH